VRFYVFTIARSSRKQKANGGIRTHNPWFTKPESKNDKPFSDKGVTADLRNDLADCLAEVVQKYPDLEELIKAWPRLSEDIRGAILRIVGR